MSQLTSISNLIKHKREIKKSLMQELGLSASKPLVAIFMDKELNKSERAFMNMLEGAGAIGVNVVILTDEEHRNILPKQAVFLDYNRKNRKKLLEAADIALGFSFNDVEEMLLHGTIPVSSKRPEIADYDPNEESGNSFIYDKNDQWGVFAALVRAIETFKFPYDWKHIVRQGVESVGN